MSHFAVAVISDGTKTIEELLAPYQENNMEDCRKSSLNSTISKRDTARSMKMAGASMSSCQMVAACCRGMKSSGSREASALELIPTKCLTIWR